jgi:hypothetical protein
MRASDLVAARVLGPDGTYLGKVTDVRVVQDGPVLGTWGAAFRVAGLVVTKARAGNFLGYERDQMRGPWLVAALVRWLHRDDVFVHWPDVVAVEEHAVRVRGCERLDAVTTTRSKG